MKLIIAEKPSLARNIAAALDITKKGNGCLTGDGVIVTWAFGHLFSLCDIEEYSPDPMGGNRWTMRNLPCFPQKYRFQLRADASGKTDDGVRRQFEIIKSLCLREDVDTVINAGDSDREGEIIVRIIIDHAMTKEEKAKKQFKRLWLPDQTPETIREAMSELPDERDYDLLAWEGYARTFIDWLYGVNLTRYATLKCGTLLRVGRVIVPIVKAIYDRDMAIKNFKPDIYYAAVSREQTEGQEIELTSKNKFGKDEKKAAGQLCDSYNAAGARVSGVKHKKDTLNPGKLYSLTKLQNFLGKKFKMSMPDSLAAVQRLYEGGYVTYPRTNSEYLAAAEKDKVKGIIAKVAKMGYPVVFKDSKNIFDDTKIESHSALIPTGKLPDKNKLPPDDAKAYGAIIRRFAAVFCERPCVISRTELKIDVGNESVGVLESFTLKGSVIIEPGWTKYDDYSGKDKILPPLKKGDTVNIRFMPEEKQTSPPKHYTIETLNNYLKNPFREELSALKKNAEQKNSSKKSESGGDIITEQYEVDGGDPEDTPDTDAEDYRAVFEGLELGTEATRTGIIDNARKSKYIELKKDVYTILPDGIYLVESLARLGIGMDKYKTAEMGKALKKVFRGEMKINESLKVAQREINAVFSAEAQSGEESDGFSGDKVGICPLCGGEVVKGKYGYGCKNYREGCKFRINQTILGKTIPIAAARELLNTGRTPMLKGFTSKNGKKFDAYLRMENGRAVFDFGQRENREAEADGAEKTVPEAPISNILQ